MAVKRFVQILLENSVLIFITKFRFQVRNSPVYYINDKADLYCASINNFTWHY